MEGMNCADIICMGVCLEARHYMDMRYKEVCGMNEVGYQEQVNNYRSSSVGKDSYAAAVRRSKKKGKAKKKSLNYNHREVSGMLLRAKRTQSAVAAMSVAKSKLGSLKRSAASGQYDRTEVSRAVTHAMRMVRCAELKVRNMKQEDSERSKAQKDNAQKKLQWKHERKRHIKQKKGKKLQKIMAKQLKEIEKKKRELEEMERKSRSNRQTENNKILEANMKYIKSAIGQGETQAVSLSAAVLELNGELILGDEQLEAQAEQKMGGEGTATTVDVISADLTMSSDMPSVDAGGASVDISL